VIALALVVALPLLGLSDLAAASVKQKNAVGSAKWCAHHPRLAKKTPACSAGTPGGGSGGGPPGSPLITIQVDPNPLVETGSSEIYAVVQVETSPSYAGDAVNIDSSQLQSSCATLSFQSFSTGTAVRTYHSVQAVLDDDGNATVLMTGFACAPGSSVVEADLDVAPFLTAVTTLKATPPNVTAPGVTGFPTTSGTLTTGEVETGDTSASGDSDVYAVFYVETNPVFTEQTVSITSPQLEDRCLRGWVWSTGGGPVNPNPSPTEILDDDGNAVFAFMGASCAAGTSVVIADVLSGFHATYTGTFSVSPPQPTI
jgi:hypothetical protein